MLDGMKLVAPADAGLPAARRARAIAAAFRRLDARLFQIVFLGSLLLFGALLRDFALAWQQVALTFAAGLGAQAFWIGALDLKRVGYLSAFVTCLGTSILVRADSDWVHPLLAALAISAKFTIRIRGKHLYNPANLAVILAIAVVPGAWASPGQWGSDVVIGLWFVCLGVTVTTSARRLDIAWAFLAGYTAMLAARLFILGQPYAVLIHQLGNGGLLLFTFFMISDPMTTPNRRAPRLLYALIVAALAYAWQFVWFVPNGPVWALFLLTPLVPVIDWLWPGEKHVWRSQARRSPNPDPHAERSEASLDCVTAGRRGSSAA
jgi:Na+-transporting NADH:ubiquinone oxidoreductase subunit NqrB